MMCYLTNAEALLCLVYDLTLETAAADMPTAHRHVFNLPQSSQSHHAVVSLCLEDLETSLSCRENEC